MAKVEFKVKLEGINGGAMISLPRRESVKFGVRGRVPVRGTLNGYPFRSSIFPTGDGGHYMAVNREVREGAQVKAGDRVQVIMETDAEPRTVELPPDLEKALAKSKAARTRFDQLSYTHRKEYVQWIEAAKRPDTRQRRLAQTIERLETSEKS